MSLSLYLFYTALTNKESYKIPNNNFETSRIVYKNIVLENDDHDDADEGDDDDDYDDIDGGDGDDDDGADGGGLSGKMKSAVMQSGATWCTAPYAPPVTTWWP